MTRDELLRLVQPRTREEILQVIAWENYFRERCASDEERREKRLHYDLPALVTRLACLKSAEAGVHLNGKTK